MDKYCVIDGKSSLDFGVLMAQNGGYRSAERDVSFTSVGGRFADVVTENNRFNNLTITYHCLILSEFDRRFANFISYLNSISVNHAANGKDPYCEIRDARHPDWYRRGIFIGAVDPDIYHQGKKGAFDVQFNCQPQKWLVSGDTEITVTGSTKIYNPSYFSASPLIAVTGTGSFQIGSKTVKVNKNDGALMIDCLTMRSYENGESRDQTTEFDNALDNPYPVLDPGETGVTLGDGITKLVITPRWYLI